MKNIMDLAFIIGMLTIPFLIILVIVLVNVKEKKNSKLKKEMLYTSNEMDNKYGFSKDGIIPNNLQPAPKVPIPKKIIDSQKEDEFIELALKYKSLLDKKSINQAQYDFLREKLDYYTTNKIAIDIEKEQKRIDYMVKYKELLKSKTISQSDYDNKMVILLNNDIDLSNEKDMK